MNKPLKCLQYNARGLNKDKKNEFKAYLDLVLPDLVFLSEIWWQDNYVPRFANYNQIFKNRQAGRGGGVALLIKKHLCSNAIQIPAFVNSEVVGASITTTNNRRIEVLSVYCPDGNESISDLVRYLANRNSDLIIAGDFNGHSPQWMQNNSSNRVGREISGLLTSTTNVILLTPPGLQTRIDPSTHRTSTLDLAIVTGRLAERAAVTKGPYLGSDHMPILFHLNT